MPSFDWDHVPVLLTNGPTLRPMGIADQHDLLQVYGDPEVMRYTDELPFPNLSYASRMLASVARLFSERRSIEWGIEQQGRLVGTCGLHSFEARGRQAIGQIGFLLARAHWGQGIMQQVAPVVIEFAHAALGLDLIQAHVDPANTRCLTLLSRLGFQVDSDADPRFKRNVTFYCSAPQNAML